MGGKQSSDIANKQIVIIGGGYGGSHLAYRLIKKNIGKVTLIEPKDGLFHNIGALRTVVDENYSSKLCIPYPDNLERCHIKAKAKEIDTKNKTVVLSDGREIQYDDLVIACGTSSPFPGKLGKHNPSPSNDEIIQMYSDFREEVRSSESIVLIGGGAVGVELAGEIKTDFPEKTVTLIHSTDELASARGKPAFQKVLRKAVEKKGVGLLLNDRVTNMQDLILNLQGYQHVHTASGKQITCNMVIACTGGKINSDFCRGSLGNVMTEMGALSVDKYLRVKGQDSIYAIGDVNDVKEEKLTYTAKLQANTLLSTLAGQPKSYRPSQFGMFIPLGRNGGVAEIKGLILGNFFVKQIKSKDLFAGMMWKDLGSKPPKASSTTSALA